MMRSALACATSSRISARKGVLCPTVAAQPIKCQSLLSLVAPGGSIGA